MKIKKYIAANMPEAMKQIRKELGPEAVILHSKEIQEGGFLGLFKKKKIEVVAALDPEPVHFKRRTPPRDSAKQELTEEVSEQKLNKEIMKEIQQLKKMVAMNAKHSREHFPLEYELVYQHLLQQEVEEELAAEIVAKVLKKHEKGEAEKTVRHIWEDTRAVIANMLDVYPFHGISDEKKVLQFVGPTGVGKTTTIAKIAALLMLKRKKKVAFITTDTYRIAAVEQLKTYARILNVPIEVVYSADDYEQAVAKFEPYDYILIDTAGRNYREEKYVNDLKQLISVQADTFLVLAATAKYSDLVEIYENFRHFPLKQVIFTKTDETNTFGSLLNIPVRQQIGIAYVTDGQDVPNDIKEVSPEAVAEMLAGDTGAS